MRELPRWTDCPHLVANPKTRKPCGSFASSRDTVREKADPPNVEIDELRHGSGRIRASR